MTETSNWIFYWFLESRRLVGIRYGLSNEAPLECPAENVGGPVCTVIDKLSGLGFSNQLGWYREFSLVPIFRDGGFFIYLII